MICKRHCGHTRLASSRLCPIPRASPSLRRCATGSFPQEPSRRNSAANLSQHLAILRSRQIVANRKDGNQVFYSIRNPVLVEVLDVMRRYFQTNLADAIQMLEEVECEASAR